jgi:hypothetical protein
VGVTSLISEGDAGHEPQTFDSLPGPASNSRERQLDAGIDHIRAKFGFNAITLASSARLPHTDDGE